MKKDAMKAVVASVALAAASMVQVSADWFNGNEYLTVRSEGIAWLDANAAAAAYGPGWHLVTITSAEENMFVYGLIQSAQLGEVWAGGFQNPAGEQDAGAGWTWVTTEAFTYSAWGNGEPNDTGGAGFEQYLGLNLNPIEVLSSEGGSLLDVLHWNDEGNLSLITGYVIERDKGTTVPDAGSMLTLIGLGALGLANLRRK